MKKLILLLAALLSLSQPCAADTYTYDALNRLTRATFANGTAIDYTYDAMGNLLSTVNVTLFTAPGAPGAATAIAGNGQVTVAFSAPASDGGDAITGYTAASTPGVLTGSCTAPCSSIAVNGLTNGTAYTFVVTATNSAGISPASAASNSVTPVAPVATFTIFMNAGANGSITPSSQTVAQGNTASFTVTPDTGYTAAATNCGGSLAGNTYTTGPITADCTVSATFTPDAAPSQASLVMGWNLLGNSINAPLDVAAAFGDTAKVQTVWKWVPAGSTPGLTYPTWAFYAPSLTAPNLAAYAASKNYEVLSTIAGGEGFWVNAKTAFAAQPPAGTAIGTGYFQNQLDPAQNKLAKGWNLVATGEAVTPSAFNLGLSVTPPAVNTIIPINLTTLWAWDSTNKNWYFYAPSLEANGGLLNYITNKNYLDFTATGKTLGQGVGFWVNRP